MEPSPHVVLCGYAFGLAVDAAIYDTLVPSWGHHVSSGMTAMVYFGPVERSLGVGAGDLRRLDQAVEHLEHAERACAENGAAAFRVEAQCWPERSWHEAALATSSRRDLCWQRARAKTRELGMAALSEKITASRRRAGRADPTRALTRREREVADLVSQGLTNRELPEQLVIAERTAENHVQHILTKLGLSNRSQLAAWAATTDDYAV